MSTNRAARGGWVSPKHLPKGPNGRALCRQCGTEVPKGRRTFCGDACVDAWRIKTDPAFLRAAVLRRDRGVCAACGLDTEQMERDIALIAHMATDYQVIGGRSTWGNLPYARARRAVLELHGMNPTTSRSSYWDADHILPVSEGGGECDLDNIRTLCLACHRTVTAELAGRRGRAKRQTRKAKDAAAKGQAMMEGLEP